MSIRILTPEEIAALEARGFTRWYPHHRAAGVVLAGGDGSLPGAQQVASVSGDSPVQQAARTALIAVAPDLLATVRFLQADAAMLREIVGLASDQAEECQRLMADVGITLADGDDVCSGAMRAAVAMLRAAASERDEARAEVERLRAQRDRAVGLLQRLVDDELLPGWLLHLLRERCGGHSHVDCHSGGWAAWVPAGVALAGPAPAPPGATWQLAGFGPTELHALVAALRRLG